MNRYLTIACAAPWAAVLWRIVTAGELPADMFAVAAAAAGVWTAAFYSRREDRQDVEAARS
jgi:hypothetical protein